MLAVLYWHFLQNHIHDGRYGSHLENLSCYLLPNCMLDGVETWWRALGQHGDSELLKWFGSDIQDGHHGSHLESLQITSSPEWYVWLSLNLMGGIGVLWKFRSAKNVLFQYPRWMPWWPSWNSSNHISSQTVSQIAQKLDGRHYSDMEVQNC